MDGSLTKRWEDELERWLEPFLQRLRRKAQRRWAPVYLKGLILPGERKSVEPMAARAAPADTQQLHHFVSTSPWATASLEEELVRAADRLVGGPDAALVVDDTALVKQGRGPQARAGRAGARHPLPGPRPAHRRHDPPAARGRRRLVAPGLRRRPAPRSGG